MTLLLVLFLLTVAVLAPRYGADSRDGRDWTADAPPAPKPAGPAAHCGRDGADRG